MKAKEAMNNEVPTHLSVETDIYGICRISGATADTVYTSFEEILELVRNLPDKNSPKNFLFSNLFFTNIFKIRDLPPANTLEFFNCTIPNIEHSFNSLPLLQFTDCLMSGFHSHAITESGHINFNNCTFSEAIKSNGDKDPAKIDIRHPAMTGHISMRDCHFNDEACAFLITGGSLAGSVILSNVKGLNVVSITDLNCRFIKIQSSEIISPNSTYPLAIYSTTTAGDISVDNCSLQGKLEISRCTVGGRILITKISSVNVSDNRMLMSINSSDIRRSIVISESSINGLTRIEQCSIQDGLFANNNSFSSGLPEQNGLSFRYALSVVYTEIASQVRIIDNSFRGGFIFYASQCLQLTLQRASFTWITVHPAEEPSLFVRASKRVVYSIIGRKAAWDWLMLQDTATHYGISFEDSKIDTTLRLQDLKSTGGSAPYFIFRNCKAGLAADQNLHFREMDKMTIDFEGYAYEDIEYSGEQSSIAERIDRIKKFGRRGQNLLSSAQPFSHLAFILAKRGERELSDRSLIESARATTRQIRNPAIKLLRFLLDALFGYGLSRSRAIITLVVWVSLGTWGTSVALERGVFVIDTVRVAAASIEIENGDVVPATALLSVTTARQDEFECRSQITPVFYALESIIPVVEFGQLKQCIIRLSQGNSGPSTSELRLWWGARIAYTLIGWLIVSISIITFSGLVRRSDR